MSASSALTLAIHDLACERDDRLLFSGLSLAVSGGTALQVVGPNGCGKTSLLRILCGLAPASAGHVSWCGEAGRSSTFHEQLAYLGHQNGIKGELSAEENLAFDLALRSRAAQTPIPTALQQLGLKGFEDMPTRMLSAGQKRRVALSRLLVCGAMLWVLDEPFTSLDRAGIADIEAMFCAHLVRGGLIVTTTHHDMNLGDARVEVLDLGARGGSHV